MKKFLLISFFIPLLLFSQTGVKTIFNKNNSPLNKQTVTCVKTDQKGLIWIGTLDGLFCFDGSKWVKLTTNNSKIPSNKILCLETKKEKVFMIL